MKHSWTYNAYCDENNNKWRKWCEFVSPLILNNTYGLPVFTKETKCPNKVFYVWFAELQITCTKYGLEKSFLPNDEIRKCLLDIKQSWIKNASWDLNNKKWRKWCMFVSRFSFNNTYSLHVLTKDTKCPIKYFMFEWSTYRLFVLNRAWKRYSLQMMIFVNVYSTLA
jgi:hypothetical protein